LINVSGISNQSFADASSSNIIKIPPNYGHGVSGAEIKVKIIKNPIN
jgi:hypothetical protein